MSSTVINTALTTKQNLFTVAAGKSQIITRLVARSPSIGSTIATSSLGYNANADDVASEAAGLGFPDTTGSFSTATSFVGATGSSLIGTAGQVFGLKIHTTDTITITVDVFGYTF